MKKTALIVLFFLAVFLIKNAQPVSAGWVDSSADEYAIALDKARGWDKPEANCNPEPIKDNLISPSSTGGTVNSEAIGKNMFDNTLRAATMAIIPVAATRCTNPELLSYLYDNSAIGQTSKMIAAMYTNPPASGVYYARDFLENFGLAKPAYAQGLGYSGLRPIMSIWKVFRNLSYIILLLVLVAIGFMVMFRMKLNAQTVVTIQTAIPNIVITLILITFSYAIAGLLIDLMYFLILIIISVFSQSGLLLKAPQFIPATPVSGTPDAGQISAWQQFFVNANLWDLMQSVINWDTVMGFPGTVFNGIMSGVINRAQDSSWHAVFAWTGASIAIVLSAIGSAILMLLVALSLLFIFVKLFFLFLNAYIQILLSVILAPFQLLIGAIPGKSTFKNWIMGLIGNLIIFPSAVAIFFLNWSIMQTAIDNQYKGTNLWSPPFLFANPSGAAVNAGPAIGLIGFGILMLTPTILNTIKGLFVAKPFLPITPGMIVSPLMQGLQTTMSAAQQRYYLGQTLSSSPLGANPILQKVLGTTPKH